MNSKFLPQREGRPEVLIDVPGVVGQFLSDLTLFDLVVEFVQNELDAGSSQTTITFGEEALVCEGNGKPIDDAGWKRLCYVLGAGGDVAPKVGGIGAKNHGLRSAFLLGDNIIVQSGGYRIDLTVRGNDTDSSRFYPAVWPKIPDATAPRHGTRVTVPYRTMPLTVPNGDQTLLDVRTGTRIIDLFTDSVDNSPSRFIAASAPGRYWHYELSLVHLDSDSKLIFDCEPLRGKHAGLSRRTCSLKTAGRRSKIVLQQLCSPFKLTLAENDVAKVPKIFRRGHTVWGELSWHVHQNYLPQAGSGALRYPIGFPFKHVRSGHGFDISGPFICGRARHSISDDPRNDLIRKSGCAAFVELTRKKLIPLFGAASMDLVSSLVLPDVEAEKLLTMALLTHHALPVVKSAVKSKRASLQAIALDSSTSPVITLASYSYDAMHVAQGLVQLAATAKNLLHPGVHTRVVNALRQLHKNGDVRVVLFNEFTAAEAILIHHTPSIRQTAPLDWVEDVHAVLDILDNARHRVSFPHEVVKKLKMEGKLPTESGLVALWENVRRSAKPIPAIPGIVEPEILQLRLSKQRVLKDSALKIPIFNLDSFVANKDFSNVIAEGRQRFFTWLRKAHSDLAPGTLSKVAGYPVWPGADGIYRALHEYCWPKSPELRIMVHSVNPAPANDVINFPGLRKSHNGALRLRTKAFVAELKNWYLKQAATVELHVGAGRTEDAAKAAGATEDALDLLRKLEEYDVRAIAEGHKTFARSGAHRRVIDLHSANQEVEHCSLLDRDVVRGNMAELYVLLGAHQKPTKSALASALVSDTNQSLLFNRLHAYKSLGYDLSDLLGMLIITVSGVPRAPSTLTFRGSTNWWGEWKVELEETPQTPERVDLLERVGVIRQALREELSQSFFDWLSQQTPTRKKQHLQQIIRHWAERRHGPSRWIHKYPAIQCIPVRGSAVDFELLSYAKATSMRSLVFLPDFREIQEKIIIENLQVRLTIVTAKGVGDSVLDVMRGVGIQSLRLKAGRPNRILTSEGVENDPVIYAFLKSAQAKTILRGLNQLLPEYDVPTHALRREWRRELEALSGTRVAGRLLAVYSLLNCEYEVAAESGVDTQTQLLCIDRKADRKLAFYDALADHLFSENSSRLWAYGLLRAIESNHEPTLFDFSAEENESSEDIGEEDNRRDNNSNEPTDPPNKGHGIDKDKLEPDVPHPKPFDNISDETKLSGKKKKWGNGFSPSSTSQRRNSIEEEEQIFQLKKEHYAWHCQACLGQYDVKEVALPNSYVYLPSFRQKLIEAHHVDHLQNKGQIGARNLLVLCTFHHKYFGDQLSSDMIKAALTSAQRVTKSFPNNANGSTYATQGGLVAEIKMDSAEGNALLFFTDHHAKAWTGSN